MGSFPFYKLVFCDSAVFAIALSNGVESEKLSINVNQCQSMLAQISVLKIHVLSLYYNATVGSL